MNVASRSTRVGVGAAALRLVTRVTEKREAPLLMVAAVFPSDDSARPKGFGAPTTTSVPAGDTNWPFGRMAPGLPSSIVDCAVGRSPAGARSATNPDGAR